MPPKPAPGKKGQVDLEDYSDVLTLPQINTVTSTVLLKEMFSSQTREQLDKALKDKLPQEPKVKVLTRDELIAYAKTKQIILEPNVAATLPQDDPRLKMTEAEQLSKAACDKMFELAVAVRRAKKEKIQKLEEEAKAQQQPFDINQVIQDLEQLDLIYNLVDFPQNKAEALAMAKYNIAVNCLITVKQQVFEEEGADFNEEQEMKPPMDENNNTDYHQTLTQTEKLNQLIDARNSSVRNSPLRFMYVCELDYHHVPVINYKVNEQGEEVEERQEPEQVFIQKLMQSLEHTGNLLAKYYKFREKVSLMPLMPDKHAILLLEELKMESEDYQQWLAESDQQFNANQSQKSLGGTGDLENTQSREQRKQEYEAEKAHRAEEEESRKKKMQEIRASLKTSVDDTRDHNYYKQDAYKKDFLRNQESKNCISSIMSAMVTQICNGDTNLTLNTHHDDLQNQDASTEPETIDDLVDELFYDLQCDKIDYKPMNNNNHNNNNHGNIRGNEINQSGNRQRKQGTQAFVSQTTIIGEVEYHEESDKSKLPLFKLPKNANQDEEEKAEDVCLREKQVFENLVLPGMNRHLMPQVPSKSERIRDAEKPGLYPFSTLPIEDAERALLKRTFQELLRSNNIDEGQSGSDKHTKYKAFERCFEQHMTPEILRQVLAEALLKEPDVATLYYPRNDSLLVCLYNKISQMAQDGTPHNELLSIELCSKFINEKEWRAAYRVMPDFDNWVKYFSDDLVAQIQQLDKAGQPHIKYQFDDEMMPDQMLDIDDNKIQNIHEKTQFYYPGDGSIMKVDTFQVSGNTYKKSVVYKDNLIFGLRQAKPDSPVSEEEKEYGLYTMKREGDVEFWMNFENDTKLLVEKVKYEKNPQRLIRIDPPKPTPEEIAAREEAVKQAQALAAKNKNNKNAPPVVIEEYKEPEPTWEPEPLDFLDSIFPETFLQTSAQVTTTLQNGLIVKFMGSGDIVQFTEDQYLNAQPDPHAEKDRVYLKKSGVIVRHFFNRDAEVLFPNGEIAKFNKQDMMWVVTNNKGRRVASKGGIKWDLESIPCAVETDAVTNARMMIREDNVMTIQFADGSMYCQHADGTLMWTSPDQTQVRIEKQGFAPVISKRVNQRISEDYDEGTNLNLNIDSVVGTARAVKGYVMETYLPDDTIVETYHDELVSGNGVRHVFKRADFTVVSIDQTGQVDIITSNARSALNESNGKRLMGQDKDFGKAIFQKHASFNNFGIYHAFIGYSMETKPSIFTVDHTIQQNYVIDEQLNLYKTENQYFGYSNPQPIEQLTHRSLNLRTEDGRELEDVGGYKNPLNKHFIFPRLFVINNDGSGFEMLTKDQLEYYFRIAKHREQAIKQRRSVMVGTTLAKTHYFVTKVKNMQDFEQENQIIKNLNFPQNAQYALYHNKLKKAKLDEFNQGETKDKRYTPPSQYTFRQIFEFQEFEAFKQEAFYDDFDRFRQWKMSQVRYDSEFGITHIPAKDQILDYAKIEDEEFVARRINTKILKERRNKRPKFDSDQFKKEFLSQSNQDDEINDFFKRGNSMMIDRELITSVDMTTANRRNPNELSLNHNYSEKFTQQHHLLQESVNQEKIRNIKKKQEVNVANQLQDIRRMINTPTFLPAYFQSKEGQHFTKNNPQKPPSQEMIMRMSQRINRSQNATEKAHSQYEQSQRGDMTGTHNNQNQNDVQNFDEGGDDKESPIVALEPEDNYNTNKRLGQNNFMGSRITQNGQTMSGPQPSLYIQEKIYLKQKEQEQILKAEEYHVVKTKDFNVVGSLRQGKPFVKSIVKSQAQSELNEKFITTECIADRRVKISSMAPRQYINAPSIEEVRKQGQHQMILGAINKKQTFAELINQANAMVTSVLHDPLKRSLNILPSNLKFGIVQAGQSTYELFITLKNEDSIAQRVTIKPMSDKRIQFQQIDTGLIAPGMTRKISVTVQSNEECTIKDNLQIMTKTDIFKIPIEAQFLSPENYQREFQEQRAISGKTLANSRVRNKLNDSIQKGRMSAKGSRIGGESIHGGSDDEYNGGRQGNDWIQTTNSESKLPVIPQANQRPFEVDPKKNLKDLLKK